MEMTLEEFNKASLYDIICIKAVIVQLEISCKVKLKIWHSFCENQIIVEYWKGSNDSLFNQIYDGHNEWKINFLRIREGIMSLKSMINFIDQVVSQQNHLIVNSDKTPGFRG